MPYHSLDEKARPYFCFEHAGIILAPKMIVFGMNEAPFYFNKIMRVVIELSRTMGIRMSSYFDDQIWAEAAEKRAEPLVPVILTILTKLGWLINEKAMLRPSQIAEHIGWEIDTTEMKLRVASKKVERIFQLATEIVTEKDKVSLRQLASLAGKLSAMRTAISAAPIFTRGMFNQIGDLSHREGWRDRTITPTREVMEEVQFWINNIKQLRIRDPTPPLSSPRKNRCE